ncbi:MAG: hypothetical protein AAGG75_21065 [Bacteroidota bacterium]
MELQALKNQLKERIALGLNYGLKAVLDLLSKSSPLYSEAITFKSQFNDLNAIANQNVLPYEQLELGLNKIRRGLISLIDRIEESDTQNEPSLAKPKNNELQFRKSNFFQLLNIHYRNLQGIIIDSSDGKIEGRQAIKFIYESFGYAHRYPRGDDAELLKDIAAFSHKYFKHRIEVYIKTVRFILEYIMEEELEQDFFMGVFQSILSTFELRCIFYYGISGLQPGFAEVLRRAELFEAHFADQLLTAEHFEALADS